MITITYTSGEHTLTINEVNQLISVIDNYEHLILIKLAINTGIRRSDIVRIRYSDINNNEITFYEQKKRRAKTIYLSDELKTDIQRLKNISENKQYLFNGRTKIKYGKGHMSSRTAYNVLQKYLKKAGLKNRPFHSLRATCVKLCQAKGWNIEQTAKHLGDTVQVIQQHYSTPTKQEMLEIVNKKKIL